MVQMKTLVYRFLKHWILSPFFWVLEHSKCQCSTLQVNFAPIISPLIDTNGSRLAKTITLPPHPKFSQMFDMETFVEDGWKQKQQSMIAAFNVCCRSIQNTYFLS